MHLVVFPVAEYEMTLVENFQIPKEYCNNKKLQFQLIDNFPLVVPDHFDDGKNMAYKGFGTEHEFLVLGKNPINHEKSHPNNIVLPDIKCHQRRKCKPIVRLDYIVVEGHGNEGNA